SGREFIRVASLRANRDGGEKRQELRGGNDARWKTPKTSFPPRLEIWQNTPDFHIPTASTAAYFFFHKTLSGSTSSKFFDGCRSPRSRSIRQRRFAPVVTAIASERVTGINSESVTAFIVISTYRTVKEVFGRKRTIVITRSRAL